MVVQARILAFLETLERDSVIVTHAGPIRMIRGALLGLGREETLKYHAPHSGVLRFSAGAETFFGE